MKKKNNLPESWCVKNDGSQLFKDTVIKYIQNKYGSLLDGDAKMYYGYSVKYDTCIDDSSYRFENLLTLSEFIELSKEVEDWEPKFGEKIWAYNNSKLDGFEVYFIATEDFDLHVVSYPDQFENRFANDGVFDCVYYTNISKLKTKLTLQQIADKFELNIDEIEII